MTINIRVNPKSSINKISSYENGILSIKITTPPVDGKANTELIKFLSKKLKIPKSSILLLKGERSKIKIVDISLNESEFLEKLDQII